MNMLLRMLTVVNGNSNSTSTSTELTNAEGVAAQIINASWQYVEIIIWVLVAALGIVLVVKGVMTALAIVKAADEPQVRQEKIGSFKFMAIGVVIAMVILALLNIILPLFFKNIEGVTVFNK